MRRFEYRYHNGRDWTGDVSVDGSRFIDPLPRLEFASSGGTPPTPARSPLPAERVPAKGSGRATAAMVLGIASVATGWVPFVFVLAAAAAVLAIAFGVAALRRASQPPSDRRARNFALTGIILAPIGLALCGVGWWLTVLAFREVSRFTEVGPYELDVTDCSVDNGLATYQGTITNLSSETRDYHLVVSLDRPGTDNSLYRQSVDVESVAPRATEPWSTFVVVAEDELDCSVESVSGPLPFYQS